MRRTNRSIYFNFVYSDVGEQVVSISFGEVIFYFWNFPLSTVDNIEEITETKTQSRQNIHFIKAFRKSFYRFYFSYFNFDLFRAINFA